MGTEPIKAYRSKTISGGRLNAYNLVTNTRPNRNEPDPEKWQTYARRHLKQIIHENNARISQDYKLREQSLSGPLSKI